MYMFASTIMIDYTSLQVQQEGLIMLITKALRIMQDAQGVYNVDVARGSGKSRSFVTDAYNRDDMRVSNACRFANSMGCELVLRKIGERDGIIISPDD